MLPSIMDAASARLANPPFSCATTTLGHSESGEIVNRDVMIRDLPNHPICYRKLM